MTTEGARAVPVPGPGPCCGDRESATVAAVLARGWLGTGPRALELEGELTRLLGAPDVLTLASATAALHIALLTVGVQPGDEVLLPSFAPSSSAKAVLACGAVPVFTEVDARTLCVRPEHLMAFLSDRTRAVVPVLYSGRAVDLGPFATELASRGIALVEDASHAFGSRQGKVKVGATGVTTCFSFDPIMDISCGEGGAIAAADHEHAGRARRLRTLGIDRAAYSRCRSQGVADTATGIGHRYHLSDINAAIGLAQLARFPALAKARVKRWKAYAERLSAIAEVRLIDPDIKHTIPLHCLVRIPDRDRVLAILRAGGIAAAVPATPNHLQPIYGHRGHPLPVTEELAGELLSLPFYTGMPGSEILRICDCLERALHR